MKLLLCAECLDIVKLIWRERGCVCGRSRGLLTEGGTAHFTGPALPLETSEHGLKSAVRDKKSAAPIRITLYVVSQDEVTASKERLSRLDTWVNAKRKRKGSTRKGCKNPKTSKPWASRRKR